MSKQGSSRQGRTGGTAAIGGCKVELTGITERPLVLTGFPWFTREGQFCRLPVDSIKKMERIRGGAWNASGAMVRFKTDSDVIAVRVKLRGTSDMSHMPRTGSSGVDLFVGTGTGKAFLAGTQPPPGATGYDAVLARLPDRRMREWTLNLPLYNGIRKMDVGVSRGSRLARPSRFAVQKPVLFYGGSITQGGCASRPGNAYSHIVCRWLDANLVNLGFSGCSKLEPVMAELIASLDVSVVVIDPTNTTLEELRERHEPFFRIIRASSEQLYARFSTRVTRSSIWTIVCSVDTRRLSPL